VRKLASSVHRKHVELAMSAGGGGRQRLSYATRPWYAILTLGLGAAAEWDGLEEGLFRKLADKLGLEARVADDGADGVEPL
jgi:hypothetical protein